MADLAKLVVKLEAQTAQYQQKLEQSDKRLKRFEKNTKKSLSNIGKAFNGLVVGAALGIFVKKVAEATAAQDAAVKQLEAGLASTGGVVGRSIDELTKKAAELQKATTFGDEEIIAAQSQLVTFTSVTGEAFDRTIEAALDLSTRMDQDLKSSVVQLGKALNDPIANLSALSRTGIQFTSQQKDTIKALVESNRLFDAQTIILNELDRQFGGSAKAARDTFGGALKSLGNAFDDLFESTNKAGEAQQAVEDLTAILQDPSVVEGINSITAAVVSSIGQFAKWASAGANAARSLAEDFAAFLNGPALGDTDRLNKKMDDLFKKQEAIINQSRVFGQNPRENPRFLALEEEIQKTQELLDLGKELDKGSVKSAAPLPAQAGEKNQPKPAIVAPVVPSLKGLYGDAELKAIEDVTKSFLDLTSGLTQQSQALQLAGKELFIFEAQANLSKDATQGMYDEVERLAGKLYEESEAQRIANEAKSEGAALTSQLQTPLEALNSQLDKYRELLNAGAISQDTFNRAVDAAGAGYDEAIKGMDEMSKFAERAAENIQDKLGDTIKDTLTGDFDGILDSWKNMLYEMASQAIAIELAEKLKLGDLLKGSGSGGGIISGAKSLFGGFFAEGGMLPSGKVSVVGENGPELVMPKGAGSQVVPNHALGGNSLSVGQMVFPGVRTEKEAKLAAGAAARELSKAMDNARRYR